MDPEDIEHEIHAPELGSLPLNHADFEENLRENIEQLAPELHLYQCCKAGGVEYDTVAVEQLELDDVRPESIRGFTILSFEENDETHYTDGTRHAHITFSFDIKTSQLSFRCRTAR